jgi:hypothetical protein
MMFFSPRTYDPFWVLDECGILNLGLLDPAGVIVEHSYIRRVTNYRSPSEVEESEVEESEA